jgi:peptide/nickel transport system substrate-binding protein
MMKHRKSKTVLALLLGAALLVSGCGNGGGQKADQDKTFTYGTVAYGTFNANVGTNPHDTYVGWSTLRYGVGETLFRFNDKMELEPWLAKDYEQLDDYTVKINLRDDICFSNGKKVTGEAVKACLEDLLQKHDRAPKDLKLESITADGQSVTLRSREKVPALLNYLSDPYGCIIDVEAGEHDKIVVGTGPYVATQVSDTEMDLVKNEHYWGEQKPQLDKIVVKSISDGDTLTMAMQNGELDAVQGLPYANLELFQHNDKYKVSQTDTSRIYQIAYNFHTPALQDLRVRQAIAMAIDKQNFTQVLLHGQGTPAVGPFPASLPFGDDAVHTVPFDKEQAKALLQEAGYTDTDGDGYVDKEGKNLELRYLTYTSRQELPLLAEAAQADLKDIGIKLDVNATNNYKNFLKTGDYDLYSNAFVTAPTGDPEYYFTTHALKNSAYNMGFYYNDKMEALGEQLRNTFGADQRAQLAIQMEQQLLDDCAYVYASHLRMSFVMKNNVSGFAAHPSDYYEITPALRKD